MIVNSRRKKDPVVLLAINDEAIHQVEHLKFLGSTTSLISAGTTKIIKTRRRLSFLSLLIKAGQRWDIRGPVLPGGDRERPDILPRRLVWQHHPETVLLDRVVPAAS